MMRFLPSKAALYGMFAALAAGILAWARMDAKRDERRDQQQKDQENADKIQSRVTDSRTDPDRLRDHENDGYRD